MLKLDDVYNIYNLLAIIIYNFIIIYYHINIYSKLSIYKWALTRFLLAWLYFPSDFASFMGRAKTKAVNGKETVILNLIFLLIILKKFKTCMVKMRKEVLTKVRSWVAMWATPPHNRQRANFIIYKEPYKSIGKGQNNPIDTWAKYKNRQIAGKAKYLASGMWKNVTLNSPLEK